MLRLSEEEYESLQKKRQKVDHAEDRISIRAAGARSLSDGKAFEEVISMSCRKYREDGKACILKTPEPFAVFSRNKDGLFTGRFTAAKAQPDFQGIMSGGRSIIFEAKFTRKDRLLQSVITQAQADIMNDHEKLGGLCFVAASVEERYFFVPWSVWKDMKSLFGRKYVKADDLPKYEVFPHTGNPFPFLECAEECAFQNLQRKKEESHA